MLTFTPAEFFTALLGFLVLLYFFQKLLLRPYLAVMDQRKRNIAENLAIAAEADKKVAENKARLAFALDAERGKAGDDLRNSQKEAAREKAISVSESKEILNREEQARRKEIWTMGQSVEEEALAYTPDIAAMMLAKLLDKSEEEIQNEIDPGIFARLADDIPTDEEIGRRLFMRIISPIPLDATQIQQYKDLAAQKYGVEVHAVNEIDTYSGMIKLVIGEIIYDATLTNKLGRTSSSLYLYR